MAFEDIKSVDSIHFYPLPSIGSGSYGCVKKGYIIRADGSFTDLALKRIYDQGNGFTGPFDKDNIDSCIYEGLVTSLITKVHQLHLLECPKKSGETCYEGSHFVVKGSLSFLDSEIAGQQGHWAISKFFRGETLYSYFEKAKKDPSQAFSLDETLEVFLQVLFGAKCLSVNDMVHRDFNAFNIMFRRGGKIKAKIIDLGASKPKKFIIPKDPHNCALPIAASFNRHPKGDILAQSSEEIDLWAIGCLLFDMIVLREPPLFPYLDEENAFNGGRNTVNPIRANPRIKFLALMELFNGPMPQEWFEHAHQDYIDLYYTQVDGQYMFKYKIKTNLTKAELLSPIYEYGKANGIPFEVIDILAHLIDDLTSYHQPTFDEAIKRIKRAKELLS